MKRDELNMNFNISCVCVCVRRFDANKYVYVLRMWVLPICGVCAIGMVLMTSVCPVTGSWASWVCAGWCRCEASDVKPRHKTQP